MTPPDWLQRCIDMLLNGQDGDLQIELVEPDKTQIPSLNWMLRATGVDGVVENIYINNVMAVLDQCAVTATAQTVFFVGTFEEHLVRLDIVFRQERLVGQSWDRLMRD